MARLSRIFSAEGEGFGPKKCPRCRRNLTTYYKYCPACGKKNPYYTDEKTCPGCKDYVHDKFVFCPWCRKRLRTSGEPIIGLKEWRKTAFCLTCLGDLPDYALYCPWCGRKFFQPKVTITFELRCRKCGKSMNYEWEFCPRCGSDTSGSKRLRKTLDVCKYILESIGIKDHNWKFILRKTPKSHKNKESSCVSTFSPLVINLYHTEISTILHEIGHSFYLLYSFYTDIFYKAKKFRKFFGLRMQEIQKKKPTYIPTRRKIGNISEYAGTSRYEDFAETFSMYCSLQGEEDKLIDWYIKCLDKKGQELIQKDKLTRREMKLLNRIYKDISIIKEKFDLIDELVRLVRRYQRSEAIKSEINFFKGFQMRAHLFRTST